MLVEREFQIMVIGLYDPRIAVEEHAIVSVSHCSVCNGISLSFQPKDINALATEINPNEWPYQRRGHVITCSCKHCKKTTTITFRFIMEGQPVDNFQEGKNLAASN